MDNKVIIFSAPSGAGKSTIVNYLLNLHPELEFSISATSRAPRGQEQHGVEYYFYSSDEFRQMIADDKFVEYEEVSRLQEPCSSSYQEQGVPQEDRQNAPE